MSTKISKGVMRKVLLALCMCVYSSVLFAAEEVLPKIKLTEKNPFNKRGWIESKLWNKADILGRFSIPGKIRKRHIRIRKDDFPHRRQRQELYLVWGLSLYHFYARNV